MKVFIVSLALILLNTSMLAYTSDLNRYVDLQKSLKHLAEDCASAAILLSEDEYLAEGIYCVDENAAKDLVDFMISEGISPEAAASGNRIDAEIKIFDDVKGYGGSENYRVNKNSPAVYVKLTYSGPDMFRLPFVSVRSAERAATYQFE